MVIRCFALLSVFLLNLGILFGVTVRAADEDGKAIPGIGPVGKIVKLHTGFKFTEGPAADREGNVYFSDIPNERIHKVDRDVEKWNSAIGHIRRPDDAR